MLDLGIVIANWHTKDLLRRCLQTILASTGQFTFKVVLVDNASTDGSADQALYQACQMAQVGDIVIACGKGHEQSMCFGTTEYPWDDRDSLRAAIKGTPLKTLPTAQ